MAEILLRDNTVVGDYSQPYIIAEMNSSHNGVVDTAKEMIRAAQASGCNCVKFQSWTPDTLYSNAYYTVNPIVKRIVQKFSFSEKELIELARYSADMGIAFSSTPYSKQEVDVLVERCDAPFIKVSSMEINNLKYLEYIAKTNCPVVLSTGMADMDEIKRAAQIFEDAGNTQLIILHCVSMYPADPENINLNNIIALRKQFSNYPIGYSDHTLGTEIAAAAIALGACVVEKHFTLDNKTMGMDNNMATEPEQMKQLVDQCLSVYMAMGSMDRKLSETEQDQRKKMRRSIVAAMDLSKGTKLTAEMLDAKRPGEGLAPDKMDKLIGRILKNHISLDMMILEKDVEEEIKDSFEKDKS